MHACIGALSQCVPAVGLAYSDKFLGVFQSAGVGDAIIDLRKADAAEAIERTMASLNERVQLADQLRRRVPAIKEDIVRTFSSLMHEPKIQ
jgi:polysaccharide pyruvyl transferase WcaK-like protein